MSEKIPRTVSRELQFEHGTAIGISNRWQQGQYCSILTEFGIVGCGIYDLETPAEFGQAIAIAKGTPQNPLVEPEDLFEAKIVGCTPKAESCGVQLGMTGREAVELMLQAGENQDALTQTLAPIQVKTIDHVTLIVADLEASQRFYVDVLGMQEVERPKFGFPGRWFQAGNTQIHLILVNDESGPAGSIPGGPRISRNHHFAFEVEDCHAATKQLKDFGLSVTDPKTRPDGPIQAYVEDPDGHVVEIFSHPSS